MRRNREKLLAAKKRHYQKHRDYILAYQKKYKSENQAKIAAGQKRWRDSLSPEEKKAKKREEYLRNYPKYQAYRDRKAKRLAESKPYGPPAPTLIQEMGFSVPYLRLSRKDQDRYQKEYRARHPEMVKKLRAKAKETRNPLECAKRWKGWYSKNKEHLKQRGKEYRRRYPENARARAKRWRNKNKEKVRESARRHYQKHHEKRLAKAREYQSKNKAKIRASAKKVFLEKYHTDPGFKILSRMRSRMYEIMRKQNHHTSVTLNLDKETLRSHIEKQFLPGMTWANHGKIWHVDHVRPCASYNFGDPEQAKACFELSNLQPLWARENIQKGKKWNPS